MPKSPLMEAQVSEILENILGFLSLEGSFDVEEKEEAIFVAIDIEDAGKLIGRHGETLTALQQIVNQIAANQLKKQTKDSPFKKIVIDVSSWRKSKEEELAHKARDWAEKVKASGEELSLEPMPAWERRVIHLTIENTDGVSSESAGEGRDRHIIIKPGNSKPNNEDTSKSSPD